MHKQLINKIESAIKLSDDRYREGMTNEEMAGYAVTFRDLLIDVLEQIKIDLPEA